MCMNLCTRPLINNAVVNMEVHISFLIRVFFFLFNRYPEVELLDHMVILCLIFLNKGLVLFGQKHAQMKDDIFQCVF